MMFSNSPQIVEADHQRPSTVTSNWLEETPAEAEYTLMMIGTDGTEAQCINTTRHEFIELKRYLAAMRDAAGQQN